MKKYISERQNETKSSIKKIEETQINSIQESSISASGTKCRRGGLGGCL